MMVQHPARGHVDVQTAGARDRTSDLLTAALTGRRPGGGQTPPVKVVFEMQRAFT